MPETPTKSYLLTGYDGAIKLYFDNLWDGVDRYINVDDWIEFSYNISRPNDVEETKPLSATPFKLIQRATQVDTWKLAGYIKAIGDNHNAFLTIGTYCPLWDHVLQKYVCYNGGGFNLWGIISHNNVDYTYDGTGTTQYYLTMPKYFSMYGGVDNEMHFSFPFPVFDSEEHLDAYIVDGTLDGCMNSVDEYDLNKTDYYFIYNLQSTGKLFNGKLTEVSGATRAWHSLKFGANKKPVLYFDDAFGLVLKAEEVVNSKAVQGPGYLIDNIPEEGWSEGVLEYSGPFYGTLEARIEYTGSLPDNGTYAYGYQVNTNIPIFKDLAAAQHAIDTGDYSAAGNFYTLQDGNTHLPIVTGDNDASTTFASGPALSPFVTSYICSKNDVLNVANAFYTNDTTILDNIKAGLSLMGSEPFQALCGLSWYPFDINKIANAQPQGWVYFGSYKYEPGSLSIDKIISLKTPGYLDAGSIYIESLFGSYRDLAPYTTLQIYLPFHGWEQIDIAKYYKKTLNVRYYVDIYTNTYACALVASGGGKSYIGDIFSGNIGISLPITGANMSEYGNSMLRAVLGTGAGIAGGAMAGLTVGNLPGAILGAGVGAAASLAGGMFEMSQKGAPKDHLMVKGAYSGGSSAYMPTNVIIRYDIHNLIVPSNLSALYGKPSSASGPVSAFSGFLQADTMKLNTSGMLANEIAAIERMLKEGIFV